MTLSHKSNHLLTGIAYGSLSGTFTMSMAVVGAVIGHNPEVGQAAGGLALFCLALLVMTGTALVVDQIERQAERQSLAVSMLVSTVSSFCDRQTQALWATAPAPAPRRAGVSKGDRAL